MFPSLIVLILAIFAPAVWAACEIYAPGLNSSQAAILSAKGFTPVSEEKAKYHLRQEGNGFALSKNIGQNGFVFWGQTESKPTPLSDILSCMMASHQAIDLDILRRQLARRASWAIMDELRLSQFKWGEFFLLWETYQRRKLPGNPEFTSWMEAYNRELENVRVISGRPKFILIDELRRILVKGRLSVYCGKRDSLNDVFGTDPCGNCVSQSLAFLALINDAKLDFGPGDIFALQLFGDHVQPVLMRENRQQIVSLMTGQRDEHEHEGYLLDSRAAIWAALRKMIDADEELGEVRSITYRHRHMTYRFPWRPVDELVLNVSSAIGFNGSNTDYDFSPGGDWFGGQTPDRKPIEFEETNLRQVRKSGGDGGSSVSSGWLSGFFSGWFEDGTLAGQGWNQAHLAKLRDRIRMQYIYSEGKARDQLWKMQDLTDAQLVASLRELIGDSPWDDFGFNMNDSFSYKGKAAFPPLGILENELVTQGEEGIFYLRFKDEKERSDYRALPLNLKWKAAGRQLERKITMAEESREFRKLLEVLEDDGEFWRMSETDREELMNFLAKLRLTESEFAKAVDTLATTNMHGGYSRFTHLKWRNAKFAQVFSGSRDSLLTASMVTKLFASLMKYREGHVDQAEKFISELSRRPVEQRRVYLKFLHEILFFLQSQILPSERFIFSSWEINLFQGKSPFNEAQLFSLTTVPRDILIKLVTHPDIAFRTRPLVEPMPKPEELPPVFVLADEDRKERLPKEKSATEKFINGGASTPDIQIATKEETEDVLAEERKIKAERFFDSQVQNREVKLIPADVVAGLIKASASQIEQNPIAKQIIYPLLSPEVLGEYKKYDQSNLRVFYWDAMNFGFAVDVGQNGTTAKCVGLSADQCMNTVHKLFAGSEEGAFFNSMNPYLKESFRQFKQDSAAGDVLARFIANSSLGAGYETCKNRMRIGFYENHRAPYLRETMVIDGYKQAESWFVANMQSRNSPESHGSDVVSPGGRRVIGIYDWSRIDSECRFFVP